MTVKELKDQATAILTALQNVPPQTPAVATQADLDEIGATLSAAKAIVDTMTPSTTTPHA